MQNHLISNFPTLGVVFVILAGMIQFVALQFATPNNTPSGSNSKDNTEESTAYYSLRSM
ncbi:MAG: hypothetical protein KGQ58_06620 [Proteobacteria bacterium]|nr:hypothetical protein [Pseudomonadota bacterium]MDE3208102.1 hypothetical protein [Pseudomonadota bacterium]